MLISHRRTLIIAALAFLPSKAASAQGKLNVSGIHSREPFCQTMIKQYDLMVAYTKSAIGMTDPAAKKKYFADQKALNGILVKTAPLSLSSDVALLARDANFSYDAQQGTDRKAMMAALAPLRKPEHLAAAKRANAYCGLSVTN
jgi:hypothetical protein